MTATFGRGEVRKLSIDLIEKNRDEPFDTIVELTSEAFGMTQPQARSHVRWLVREGLVNKAEELQASWPKRARKVKAEKPTKAKKTKSKKTATVKTTAADVVAAVTPSEPVETGVTGGMNKSMADMAAKFAKFRKDKAAVAA
jgi:DNA-binding transcriptional ArsR family regulator